MSILKKGRVRNYSTFTQQMLKSETGIKADSTYANSDNKETTDKRMPKYGNDA